MKRLIFIIGKTNSGKDTVADYLYDKYRVNSVCSFTTRPKRDYEIDGVQHYFRSIDEFAKIRKESSIIAYTKFPQTGFEYMATVESMNKPIMSYIIDPNGIDWFLENSTGDVDFKQIFVNLSESTIRERAINRGDKLEDIETRLSSERLIFDKYRDDKRYDFLISNEGNLDSLKSQIDSIMRRI